MVEKIPGALASGILCWHLQTFHVKPYEASDAETNLFVSISKPIKVGREASQH